MNQLQRLKMALIAYVNSMKTVWSAIAYPLSIVSKRKCKLKDYRIYGNSVQDGAPTPENPIEVQSVGEKVTEGEYAGKYKVPVTVRGKNLLDLSRLAYHSISEAGLTAEPYGKDGIRVYGTPEEVRTINLGVGNVGYGYDFPYKAGTVFRMSVSLHPAYNNITGNSSIGYFSIGKSDNGWSTYITCSKKELTHDIDKIEVATVTITPKDTEAYLDFVILPQLELGDTATPYEPYIEPQTFDIYLDAPLRKIGNYKDYIDFGKGAVIRTIEVRKVKNFSWAKSSNMQASDGTTLYRYEVNANRKRKFVDSLYSASSLICDGLKNASYYGSTLNNSISERVALNASDTTGRYIRILTAKHSTVTEMLSAFGEFNIYYILDNTYKTEKTIELPTLPTFKGTTIYEVDTEIKPSGMEVCYYE